MLPLSGIVSLTSVALPLSTMTMLFAMTLAQAFAGMLIRWATIPMAMSLYRICMPNTSVLLFHGASPSLTPVPPPLPPLHSPACLLACPLRCSTRLPHHHLNLNLVPCSPSVAASPIAPPLLPIPL
ncbi:hypothetical protein AMTR_s00042p00225500 [Amborella trichopoda]|uniref:Uncharacterized protein n=1 Tax=Amborella trichopoda TaxID=13333 RepID=W1P9G0_AMBTC|nr:hypothetical protein AMTR_s00042p00225500 [Amborella trichopoda]